MNPTRKDFFKKTDLLILLFITLVNYLVLSPYLKINVLFNLFSDNAIYATLAKRFASGDINNALHIWWQPLYPFLASLIIPLTQSPEKSLYFISVISGILLFIPVYLLVKLITGSYFYSVVAGLLTVFSDRLINSFFVLLTENLYALLFTISIFWVLLVLKFQNRFFAFFSGLFFGITYLARNDILLPVQIYFASLLILLLFKKISLKKLILLYLLITAGFIIAVSPYLIFNYQKFGYLNLSAKLNASLSMPAYFAPQNNITTTYAQEVWSIDTPNYDSKYFNEKFDFWKYRTNMIEGTRDRLISYFRLINDALPKTDQIILWVGFFLSGIYFFKFFKPGLFLNVLFILNFFLSVPFHPGVDIRYLFWSIPIIATFWTMALFVPSLFWLKISRKWKVNKNLNIFIRFLPVIIFNLIFVTYFFNQYRDNLSPPPQAGSQEIDQYKIVGSYIKELDKNNPRIMTRREAITYFASGETIYIPTSIGTEELREYAKLWNVDFVVSDRFTFIPDSALGHLVDEKKAPEWLVPVKIWEGNITKTILYTIKL